MVKYTFADLFAGAGGFTEGMLLAGDESQGFRLTVASDIHPSAQLTHEHRYKETLKLDSSFHLADIRSRDFPDRLAALVSLHTGLENVDVVVGGPPCQGFSVFGPRHEYDPRNGLFLPYLKAIQRLRPRYFVMENVLGLAMMYGGKMVKRIHDEVSKMKPTEYALSGPVKVNAADYGVPQLRERVLFIGSRKDCPSIGELTAKKRRRHVTVAEAIGDLAFLRPWESNGRYHPDWELACEYQRESRRGRLFKKLGIKRQDHGLHNHDAAKHTPDVIARFAMMAPGKGFESIPEPLWNRYLRSAKKWCQRLRPDRPSFTVMTLPDDLVHYGQPRILTVREMARLQSFDDTFVFLGPRATGGGGKGNKKRNVELPQYTQVGNAVPPLLARAIGDTLIEAMSG